MITMTTPSSDCWRYKLHQSKSANLFLCPTPRRICIVFLDIISSGSVHSIACWVVTSICWIISNNAIMSWPWIQSTFKYGMLNWVFVVKKRYSLSIPSAEFSLVFLHDLQWTWNISSMIRLHIDCAWYHSMFFNWNRESFSGRLKMEFFHICILVFQWKNMMIWSLERCLLSLRLVREVIFHSCVSSLVSCVSCCDG